MSRYLFFEKSVLYEDFVKKCEKYALEHPKRHIISLASFDFSLEFLKGRDKEKHERQYIQLNTMFFEESLKRVDADYMLCENYIVIKSRTKKPSFEFFESFLVEGQIILFPCDALVTNMKESLILTPYCNFNDCASACARLERLIKSY